MDVQVEFETMDGADGVDGSTADRPPISRINLSGDLDDLLDERPVFRRRRLGYDRLQVDNYVTWAEAELATAHRYADHLLAGYGRCAAELQRARQEPVAAHRDVDLAAVSDRLGQLLRLAADEAAEVTAAGVDEAERLLAEARTEAQARWENVTTMRAAAAALVEEARRDRAEAAELLGGARTEAADLRAEVANLRRQRDDARQSLQRLTDQIGEALQAVTITVPGDLLVAPPRARVASS